MIPSSFLKCLRRVGVLMQIIKGYLGPRTKVGTITVFGSRDFILRTSRAIKLLKTKAPDAHRLLHEYIGVIILATPSGVFTRQLSRTSATMITMSHKMSCVPLTEYAAALAHEAFHCELYVRYEKANPGKLVPKPEDIEGGERGESLCLEYQCDILRQLGVSEDRVQQYEKSLETRWWEVPFEERNW